MVSNLLRLWLIFITFMVDFLLHLWVEAKDFDVILIVVSLHFINSKA